MNAHNISGTSGAVAAASRADFGDVAGEFEALRSRCGVFDLSSRAKVAVTGSDRTRWLNGMLTNNVRDLTPGHGVYAFLLNPQGHILGDLYAYNRGDSLMVDTDRPQLEKILATFEHYIIMDDVEVGNLSDKLTAIGIAGPAANAALRAAGIEPGELQPLQLAEITGNDTALTIVRSDNPGIASYELWTATGNFDALWEAILKAGARPVGASALELMRIACGIPRYGQDIRERDLPQETEQQRALHFSKGCYIGQEIVERIRSRGAVHRKFSGFVVHGPAPPMGTKIQSDGKDVGEVTSIASLPRKAAPDRSLRALGYVRREIGPNKELFAGEATLATAALPFADIL